VPLGQNPQRSKKGVYSIKDNTIAFWFHNVYGKLAPPNEEELNEFISRRFEMFCKDFLAEYLKGKGESVVRTGRWWGQTEVRPGKFEEREIDIIVETKNSSFVGECKWTNKKIRFTELEHLEESSKALKTKKPIKKVLFPKKGFEFKEASDIMLFDPERIEIEINKLP
jgi:AAA+ ATPase superfamily predicted ATPase